MVDWIWETCELISSPGTMLGGLSLKLAGRPKARSVPLQSGAAKVLPFWFIHPLPMGLGNSQPAALSVGQTVLRSSVWNGWCTTLDPRDARGTAVPCII